MSSHAVTPQPTQSPQLKPHEYAELGFRVVPWANRKANDRKPLISNWLDTHASTATVKQWEDKWPECDWAIVPVDHVVLDIEMKNGLNGEQDLLNLFPDVDWSIYPQTKSFTNGRHIWMRLPDGWTKKGGVHIAHGLEVKCRNGSAHIPPSTGYSWIRRLDAYEIPVAPDCFLDVWRECRPVSQAVDPTVPVPTGGRHAFLCGMAGKLINGGLQGDILFTTLRTIANERCEKPEEVTDEEIRGIADSYNEKDADSFELRLIQGESAAVSVEAFFSRPVAPMSEPVEHSDATLPSLTSEQLRPTALIAEWVDWVLSGAPRRQPELTLLAACVGIGLCVGRKLTWQNTHANIYGMALASSGSGKNDPLSSITKVLEAAGAVDLIGASDIGSDAGLIDQMATKPEIVWCIDEFALILENLNKPNCPGYVTYIAKYLLALHSCDPYRGKALKGTAPVVLENPYPCLYTCTQPKVFLGAYNDKMADSGLLGRFTVFLGDNLPRANPRIVRRPPPESLVEGIKVARDSTRNFFKAVGGKRETVEILCDEEVYEYYLSRYDQVEDYVQKHKDSIDGTLAARTMERANKFALIHAWSLNPSEPKMTIPSIEWGIQIAEYSNACMKKLLADRIVNVQDEHSKFMYDVIFKSGSTGIMPSRLISSTHRIDRHRRDSILQDLIESGKVVTAKTKAESGKGRPALRYIAAANLEKQ